MDGNAAMTLHHAPGCTHHDEYETTGALGDLMVRCRTCKRQKVARPAAPAGFTHAPGCTRPEVRRTIGRLGDEVFRCPSCDGFVVVKRTPSTTPAPVATPVATPVAAPVAASNYRCGNHPDQRVTWRGTGCPHCEADHRHRMQQRRRASRARATTPAQ